jgi:hypothetical protein
VGVLPRGRAPSVVWVADDTGGVRTAVAARHADERRAYSAGRSVRPDDHRIEHGMALSRGSRVRLHHSYAANARTILPAGTVGTVQQMYTLDDETRYVVAFGTIEAVLYRVELEWLVGTVVLDMRYGEETHDLEADEGLLVSVR